MLAAKLTCTFLTPSGKIEIWECPVIPLDELHVTEDTLPNDTNITVGKKKKKKKRRRVFLSRKKQKFKCKRNKGKKENVELNPTWQPSCTEHLFEKVYPSGQRDNGEFTWRCAVCNFEM